MAKANLSVVIITKNEEDNMRDCLESVAWADEIVIVDSGSEDNTLAICKNYTDKILTNKDWKGFGYQKNLALQQATKDWVLSLDADERVTAALRTEIENKINNSADSAFAIPRQTYFLGQAMKHGGWWPDYVVRLFRRNTGVFSEDIVHERVLVNEPVRKLSTPLLHYSYTSLDQLMVKMNHYSSAGADKAYRQGKSSSLLKAIAKAKWTFFRAYFLRLGILDGQAGFIAAFSKAEETYYRYLKLSYLKKEHL
ncbi:MAG: glycosyltransferase family 2 protein [Methylococcales bacterium]|nr:glycosyltransferase family 2 protein [Methylococcales bacterium]